MKFTATQGFLFLTSFFVSIATTALSANTWRSTNLPATACDLSETTYEFASSAAYREANAFLYMWAIHMLESQDLDRIEEAFLEIGFRNLRFINPDKKSAQVLIADLDSNTHIFIRGTVSAREILLNAMFYQKNTKTVDKLSGRIHRGMLGNYRGMVSQIEEQLGDIDSFNNRKIYLAGHSLGAAMATMVGTRLEKNGFPVAGIYNSATPRIGNSTFFRDVELSIGQKLYHTALERDIVPNVPPAKWNAKVFSEIVRNEGMQKNLQKTVIGLDYDHIPGQLMVFTPTQAVRSIADSQRISAERAYWKSMRSLLEEGSLVEVVTELRKIAVDHSAGSYLCLFKDAN